MLRRFVRQQQKSTSRQQRVVAASSTSKYGKTIGEVWSFVKGVYRATCRDHTYAYGGVAAYANIDRLYSTAPLLDASCCVVLLIDTEHPDWKSCHDAIAALGRDHGVVIAALTIFGDPTAVGIANDAVLRLRRDDDDTTDADAALDPEGLLRDDGTNDNDVIDSTIATMSSLDDRCHVSAKKIEVGDIEEEKEEEEEDDGGVNDDAADEIDIDELVTIGGMRRVGFYRHAIRNAILRNFFAELLLYIRPLIVCDVLGLIEHKSFKLVSLRALRDSCARDVPTAPSKDEQPRRRR